MKARGNSASRTCGTVDAVTGEVSKSTRSPTNSLAKASPPWATRSTSSPGKNSTGFVYDKASFSELARFEYPTEGWGITHDGEQLIVSDGTSILHFWDPTTLEQDQQRGGHPLWLCRHALNELEYIDGEVWANIWQTNTILRIDPTSGQVTGVVDLAGCSTMRRPEQRQPMCSTASPMTRPAAAFL